MFNSMMNLKKRPVVTLLSASLALASLNACGGETEESTPSAGAGVEVGAPAGVEAGGTSDTAGAEAGTSNTGSATAGAEAGAEAGTTSSATAGDEAGAEAGTTSSATAGAEAGAEAGTTSSATAGAEPEGGEVVIEISGTEAGAEELPPIDESVPGEGAHAFTMLDINGEEVDMRRYRGKVALIVNVASRCGYTGQYEGLQALYEAYRDQGFVILGFPANNFGSQEPGTNEEIAEFCSANYGVTFPMFAKISVKGDDMHPLYAYLTGESGQQVSWNFNKFLINAEGAYVQHYLSQTTPESAELRDAIEALLGEAE